MSKGFYAEVKGLEGVLKKFEKMDKRLAKTLDLELDRAADNVAADARANAPRGKQARLVSSIAANKSVKYSKSVGASARFAAFVEFGTGSGVFKGAYNFTTAEKAYARRFYVSGKGRMRSRAFLFPALHKEIPRLLHRIDRAIEDSI